MIWRLKVKDFFPRLFSNKPIIFRYPCLNHLTTRAVKGYVLHHQTILKMVQNFCVSTDSTPWA